MTNLKFVPTSELKEELQNRDRDGNVFVLGKWGSELAFRVKTYSYCFEFEFLVMFFGLPFVINRSVSITDMIPFSDWLNNKINKAAKGELQGIRHGKEDNQRPRS